MSLQFIHKFQLKIYSLLSEAEGIRNNVEKIHLSIVQDGKCPFLLISINKVRDISKFSCPIYEIDFEISIFARDKNQGLLTLIAENASKALTNADYHFDEYIIAGIKAGELSFTKAQDLVLNKLTISYKALLKKEVT